MDRLVVSAIEPTDETAEVVERKGLGHPDTICDALAESFSRALSREYRRRFGDILHHNVDKALLWGGRAIAKFGGGEVISPINVYLAGRATSEVGAERIPIEDIAIESSRAWLRANIHALDPERHVRINVLTRQVSQDLQMLFAHREQGNIALCNDTSVGVGHAPLSPLEQFVLAVEKHANGRDRCREMPAWGEDIKVMGVRCGNRVRLTIAYAMIGRYLTDIDDYLSQTAALADLVQTLAAERGFPACEIDVNSADRPSSTDIYLTVKGTSAEAGGDGQVGRGNRVNGLITPCQSMSLEAAAGKNPVTPRTRFETFWSSGRKRPPAVLDSGTQHTNYRRASRRNYSPSYPLKLIKLPADLPPLALRYFFANSPASNFRRTCRCFSSAVSARHFL
jgi:S-adenosylmethionine synthetase